MKKSAVLTVLLLMFTLSLAFAKVELKSAQIKPTSAAPGDTVCVRVEFTGEPDAVKSVVIMVREYPYDAPKFRLKKTADQSVWTLKTVVPWDSPVQSFHLDIGAIDKNDIEVITSGFENNETGKAGSLTFEVK